MFAGLDFISHLDDDCDQRVHFLILLAAVFINADNTIKIHMTIRLHINKNYTKQFIT